MVDWAYVNGMGDDCGDPDHDIHDPDGHCGPGTGVLLEMANTRRPHAPYRTVKPAPRCNRCGSKNVFWQLANGSKWVLHERGTKLFHNCPTTADGFDDEPIL